MREQKLNYIAKRDENLNFRSRQSRFCARNAGEAEEKIIKMFACYGAKVARFVQINIKICCDSF